MEFNVKTLEGKDAGKVSLSDEIFGLDPREDLIARMIRYQLAKKRAGYAQDQGPFGSLPHRLEDVQAEGHRSRSSPFGPRSAVPRRW